VAAAVDVDARGNGIKDSIIYSVLGFYFFLLNRKRECLLNTRIVAPMPLKYQKFDATCNVFKIAPRNAIPRYEEHEYVIRDMSLCDNFQ
jgi:hypothetical protein